MFAFWIINVYVLLSQMFFFYSDNELNSIFKCALATSNIALLFYLYMIYLQIGPSIIHIHTKVFWITVIFIEMSGRQCLLVISHQICLTYQHHNNPETVFPKAVEIYIRHRLRFSRLALNIKSKHDDYYKSIQGI